MNTRTRTIASFFTVAMAAMLVGAVVTNQIQKPARAAEALGATASPPPVGPGGSITLDTFKDIARRQTAGVVNINTKRMARRYAGRLIPFIGAPIGAIQNAAATKQIGRVALSYYARR